MSNQVKNTNDEEDEEDEEELTRPLFLNTLPDDGSCCTPCGVDTV